MVDVTDVNIRISQGLGDRMVTIENLPATVVEFRGDRQWHIASIVTERNLTRRMEPNELVIFDTGPNVKDILNLLEDPPISEVPQRRRQRADAAVSLLEEAAENIRLNLGKGQFGSAERLARAALTEIVLLAEGRG